MSSESNTEIAQAAEAFVAELKHWREVAGRSQKALAKLVGYTPSYISKVENGALVPSREFAAGADKELQAGGALVRRWKDLRDVTEARPESSADGRHQQRAVDNSMPVPSSSLIVEHEHAQLTYREGVFETRIRRQLTNVGTEPVTRYLIRIAVDRHPGDPERSNALYRENPLTWEEIALSPSSEGEPMSWRVQHDRDAFKEVWLLFENNERRFPLYPGQTAWIEYVYSVQEAKWGPWWQRAIRLPTRLLSMVIDLPSDRNPAVWGMETSMSAEASALRTPIASHESGDRTIFTWSTEKPPLHARYRIEWKFRAQNPSDGGEEMTAPTPSERMRILGIAQEGDPILTEIAKPFDLPSEAEDARRVIAQLVATAERVAQAHTFAKGMGIAAPQIGIGRRAAIVRTTENEIITLLNPRVIDESTTTDEQYEGCLSFFDVRGRATRPTRIEIEHQATDGNLQISSFEDGLARLVGHEIDHLDGKLYTTRMKKDVALIPISEYKGTGKKWERGSVLT